MGLLFCTGQSLQYLLKIWLFHIHKNLVGMIQLKPNCKVLLMLKTRGFTWTWGKDRNIFYFLPFWYLIRVKPRLSYSNFELWIMSKREGEDDSSRFHFVIRILLGLNMTVLQNYIVVYFKQHGWGPEKSEQSNKKARYIPEQECRIFLISSTEVGVSYHFAANPFVSIKLRETSNRKL